MPTMTATAAPPRASSALSRYLSEIRAFPLLSKEQEMELGSRIANGVTRSQEELVVANLGFVVKIASEYQNLGLPFDDLVNEGNLGLIHAASRYDPGRGTRFITYASWWVRKSILKALDEQGSVVRVPAYQRIRAMRERESRLDHGTGPYVAAPYRSISLDEEARGDRRGRLADLLADTGSPDPESQIMRRDNLALLERGVALLGTRERTVVVWRFGLDGAGPLTLTEVSERLGVSRERVRQIESAACGRLRRILENARGNDSVRT